MLLTRRKNNIKCASHFVSIFDYKIQNKYINESIINFSVANEAQNYHCPLGNTSNRYGLESIVSFKTYLFTKMLLIPQVLTNFNPDVPNALILNTGPKLGRL